MLNPRMSGLSSASGRQDARDPTSRRPFDVLRGEFAKRHAGGDSAAAPAEPPPQLGFGYF